MRPPGKPHGEHGRLGHWAGGRVPKGNVRGLLLAALLDSPAHGYELMRRLEGQAGGRWRPSPGSVYPLLQLLEDEGLVSGRDREGRAAQPPRRRKPLRPVEVVSVSKMAPRLVSVLVCGDALDGFRIEAPTSHVKVFLPADGQDEPAVRTYTPVRFDEATKTLELQFVLHGTGPASEWAERAAPGDKLAVAGPGGRFTLDETATHWWLAADESAIPAVATLLEALPATAIADVHIEVANAADEIAFDSPAKTTVSWHHRRSPGAFGAELDEAARAADIPAGARIWVACEAAAMRGIRRYFRDGRGLLPGSMVTRGYWRLGEANHPDHDYGDDELAD